MAEADEAAGAEVCTFGRTFFCDDKPSHFCIKNDTIVAVATGDSFSLILTQLGRVFALGRNSRGQLGLGHNTNTTKPTLISKLRDEKVVRIACGFEHSLVSTEAGTVYAFGANNEGQLGIGTEKDMNEPVALGLSGGPLKSLSCGLHHSAAITADGKLMMWGDGSSGQLGLGNKSSLVPKQVKVKHAVLVSCGNYHTGVVTASGDAYMFGENDNGKLGLGPKAFGSDVTKPTKIASLPKHHIKALSCGANHTAFLTVKGTVMVCGEGPSGQLGLGKNCAEAAIPTDMPLPDLQLEDGTVLRPKAASVSCGQDGTAVVDTTGKVFVCGSGRHGKLGLEGEDDVFTPTPVAELALDYRVLQVACGGGHMLALTVEADDIEYSDEDPDELNGVEDELESLSSTDDDEEAEAEGAGVGGDGEEQEEAEVEVSGENGEGGEGEGGAAATAAAPLDPRARFRQNRPMLSPLNAAPLAGQAKLPPIGSNPLNAPVLSSIPNGSSERESSNKDLSLSLIRQASSTESALAQERAKHKDLLKERLAQRKASRASSAHAIAEDEAGEAAASSAGAADEITPAPPLPATSENGSAGAAPASSSASPPSEMTADEKIRPKESPNGTADKPTQRSKLCAIL